MSNVAQLDDVTESLGQVRSLSRGLAVLDMLLAQDSVRTTDVAARLGLDKGACSRILQTLVKAGYAEHSDGRRYRRSRKLHGKFQLTKPPTNLKVRARPLLQRISDATGESAHLAILADDQVLYIDRVEAVLPLRVDRPAGTLAPLHSTALGRIFLAYELAPIPEKLQFPFGKATSRADFEAQLRNIVINGYAVDDEDFSAGIRCVAAPLREADSVVAAISLSGPSSRIEAGRLEKLGLLLAEIAETFAA
jgi:DNA-binding IclR family transcriptional regulator